MTPIKQQEIAQALAKMTAEATKAACLVVQGGTEAICMGMSGAVGCVMGIAHYSSKQTKGEKPRITDDQFLFACLLMAEVGQINSTGTGCAINFNPTAVAAAIAAFEKLTGRDPRVFLHEGLVEIAEEELDLTAEQRSQFGQFLPQ